MVARACLLCLVVFTLPIPLHADTLEPEEESLEAHFPLVPQALLKRYITAAQETDLHLVAQALRRDTVEPKRKEWSQAVGLHVDVEYTDFLGELTENGEERAVQLDETSAYLEFDRVELPHGEDFHLTVILLVVRNEEGDQAYYRIPANALEELRFEFAAEVTLRDRLSERIGHLVVRDESMLKVLERLCGRAEVDYLAAQHGGQVSVTLSIRDRSIYDCLRMAARVAGLEVRVSSRISSAISWSEAFNAYLNRDFLNAWNRLEPAITDPMSALEYRIREAGKESSGERQLVELREQTKESRRSR